MDSSTTMFEWSEELNIKVKRTQRVEEFRCLRLVTFHNWHNADRCFHLGKITVTDNIVSMSSIVIMKWHTKLLFNGVSVLRECDSWCQNSFVWLWVVWDNKSLLILHISLQTLSNLRARGFVMNLLRISFHRNHTISQWKQHQSSPIRDEMRSLNTKLEMTQEVINLYFTKHVMQTSDLARFYFANLDGFEQLNRHDLDQFLSVSDQTFLIHWNFCSTRIFLINEILVWILYDRQIYEWMENLKLYWFLQYLTVWLFESTKFMRTRKRQQTCSKHLTWICHRNFQSIHEFFSRKSCQ